jgi:hypothetical protein
MQLIAATTGGTISFPDVWEEAQSMGRGDPKPLIGAIDRTLPKINNGYNWVVKVPDVTMVFK